MNLFNQFELLTSIFMLLFGFHELLHFLFLCDLVRQTYQHASSVIQSLVEEDINVKFLVQLDKLVRLLETPIFAYLRLQVHTSADSQTFISLLILVFSYIILIKSKRKCLYPGVHCSYFPRNGLLAVESEC